MVRETQLSADNVGICGAVHDDLCESGTGGRVIEGAIMRDGKGMGEEARGNVDLVGVLAVAEPGGVVKVGGERGDLTSCLGIQVGIDCFFEEGPCTVR